MISRYCFEIVVKDVARDGFSILNHVFNNGSCNVFIGDEERKSSPFLRSIPRKAMYEKIRKCVYKGYLEREQIGDRFAYTLTKKARRYFK